MTGEKTAGHSCRPRSPPGRKDPIEVNKIPTVEEILDGTKGDTTTLAVNSEVIQPEDPRYEGYSLGLDKAMKKLDGQMAKLDDEINDVFHSPYIAADYTSNPMPEPQSTSKKKEPIKPKIPIKPKEPDVIDLLTLGKKDSTGDD